MSDAEQRLWDELEKIFNLSDDGHNWPFQDCHWDDYDNSLELDQCHPDFRVSEEQRAAILELGFGHFWTNHTNGVEGHFNSQNASWKHVPTSTCAWIKEPETPFTEPVFEPDQELNDRFQEVMKKAKK